MVMKGSLLMAIRYDSSRSTKDLDFSTTDLYTAEDADALLAEFEAGLATAAERLPYGTACQLQSRKIEPTGENKTHHSLMLTVGYVDPSNPRALASLRAGNAPPVVQTDRKSVVSGTSVSVRVDIGGPQII